MDQRTKRSNRHGWVSGKLKMSYETFKKCLLWRFMIPSCFMCVKILLDDFMFSLFFDKTCQYKFYVCPIKFLICMRGQRIREHAQHGKCLILSLSIMHFMLSDALYGSLAMCDPLSSELECEQELRWLETLTLWQCDICNAQISPHFHPSIINICCKIYQQFHYRHVVNWGGNTIDIQWNLFAKMILTQAL